MDVGEIKVLFICTGNICRSPMAEVVFRQYAREAGLTGQVTVASAGTHDFNSGQEPDYRAWRTLVRRGYGMHNMRARQVSQDDFRYFDYLLAMDESNLSILKKLCPPDCVHKLGLFTQYSASYTDQEIRDPYNGDTNAFELVLDLVESAATGFLKHIQRELIAGSAKPR